MATIAPWFCLRLPFYGPEFESQAHHLGFFILYYWNCIEKITKINKKRPGLAHFLKNLSFFTNWSNLTIVLVTMLCHFDLKQFKIEPNLNNLLILSGQLIGDGRNELSRFCRLRTNRRLRRPQVLATLRIATMQKTIRSLESVGRRWGRRGRIVRGHFQLKKLQLKIRLVGIPFKVVCFPFPLFYTLISSLIKICTMLNENADARFELWIAGIRSDRSANFTTLTVPVKVFWHCSFPDIFFGPF